LALYVEEWNTDRKNDEKGREYLILLQEDIKSDTTDLGTSIRYYQRRKDHLGSLVEILRTEPPLPMATVDSLFWNLYITINYVANTETFQSMISSGDLELITNQSIKTGYYKLNKQYNITYKYYDNNYIQYLLDFLVRTRNYYSLDQRKFFDASFVQSEAGINDIVGGYSLIARYQNHLKESQKQAKNVLTLIQDELKK
ncbi:MAG: hypothetical protein RIA69_05505, partial [Cyclobacteriaceae bacterium]